MDLAAMARAELRAEMGRRNISVTDVAEKMGKQPQLISRALQDGKPLKCKTAAAMAAAMGMEFCGLGLRLREVE